MPEALGLNEGGTSCRRPANSRYYGGAGGLRASAILVSGRGDVSGAGGFYLGEQVGDDLPGPAGLFGQIRFQCVQVIAGSLPGAGAALGIRQCVEKIVEDIGELADLDLPGRFGQRSGIGSLALVVGKPLIFRQCRYPGSDIGSELLLKIVEIGGGVFNRVVQGGGRQCPGVVNAEDVP